MSLEGDYKWLHMLRWVRRVGWVYICGMCTRFRASARQRQRRERRLEHASECPEDCFVIVGCRRHFVRCCVGFRSAHERRVRVWAPLM